MYGGGANRKQSKLLNFRLFGFFLFAVAFARRWKRPRNASDFDLRACYSPSRLHSLSFLCDWYERQQSGSFLIAIEGKFMKLSDDGFTCEKFKKLLCENSNFVDYQKFSMENFKRSLKVHDNFTQIIPRHVLAPALKALNFCYKHLRRSQSDDFDGEYEVRAAVG